ncbi:MAG: hypothetical protein EPN68_13690 [Rhodanobacter sp.]|nr:MAG: hypothetical protein EPN68_13690 [Rhodanobacter sp.]
MKAMVLKGRHAAAKFATGLGGMVLAGAAAAQTTDDFATPVVTELTSGKSQIVSIGAAVLVLVAVVALIRHIRSAAR